MSVEKKPTPSNYVPLFSLRKSEQQENKDLVGRQMQFEDISSFLWIRNLIIFNVKIRVILKPVSLYIFQNTLMMSCDKNNIIKNH